MDSFPSVRALPNAYDWLDRLPFYQAGLQGYSSAPMRIIARRQGCPYAVTEAILDRFLLTGGKAIRAAEVDDEDHPIAGQIMGSNPRDMAAAAKIMVDLGYDVVDLNFACPVKKMRHEPRGGHLLEYSDTAMAILKEVRQTICDTVPLSVKLRRSFNDEPESEHRFYSVFETIIEEGYSSVTVHGRTVEQKYVGPSRWPFLKNLVTEYPDFPILGSGDIFTAQAIFDMIRETGVRGVSVARGAIGNPWVFRQAKQILAGVAPTTPTVAEQREVLEEQCLLSLRFLGEKEAGRMMRKFGIKMSEHHPNAAAVRQAFVDTKTLPQWWHVLTRLYR